MNSESKEGIELTITAVGDVWMGGFRRTAVYDEPEYMGLVKLIRNADVGFVNIETLFLDEMNKVPYQPIGQPIGIERHSADPIIAEDLKWMGFNICATAMNHSNDFGTEGIFSTKRVLDEAGFTQAGIGATLSEATLPSYMQTKKGAVAIISAYSSPFWGQMATDPTPLAPDIARPGVNGIRADWVVDPTSFEKIREVLKIGGTGLRNADQWWKDYFGTDDVIHAPPLYIIKGDEPGTYAYTQPRKADLERNLRAVKGAAGTADWVIFALHDHTRNGIGFNPNDPSSSTKTTARACIDAGADAFFGTGGTEEPGCKGIEIYKNKPIFWTLGVWWEAVESMWRQPWEVYDELLLPLDADISTIVDRMNQMFGRKGTDRKTLEKTWGEGAYEKDKELYWSSFLATMKLEGEQGPNRKVTEIKLYPCDQRGDRPRAQRGRPLLTKGRLARKILGRLKENSAKYGTEIQIKKDIGIVKL